MMAALTGSNGSFASNATSTVNSEAIATNATAGSNREALLARLMVAATTWLFGKSNERPRIIDLQPFPPHG
jgi:hypothetical protein